MDEKLVHSSSFDWHTAYLAEVELFQRLFRDGFVEAHHIGSTAIDGIASKPYLDIALVIRNLEQSMLLEKHDYEFRGWFNIPFRFFFAKRTASLKVNLHVMLPGNPELDGFLAFRDFMNTHEEFRREYSELKSKIKHLLEVEVDKRSLKRYTLEKNDFISKILKLAEFCGYCMRLVSHYAEIDYERGIFGCASENDIRAVFYKGADIIGYANADAATKDVRFFQVGENEVDFRNRLVAYLESL